MAAEDLSGRRGGESASRNVAAPPPPRDDLTDEERAAVDAFTEHMKPVLIPKDKAARAHLAQMAGLTEDERLALDQWCDEQATQDERRSRVGLERIGDAPMATRQSGSSTGSREVER